MAQVVDWDKIKTEYITTKTSYRKLASKYDVPLRTLTHRGKTEKWVEMREQHCSNVMTKTLKEAEDKAVDYKSTLYDLAYKVAQDLVKFTTDYSISELVSLGVKPKDITGAIKDLEDVLHVKSEADLREQEARIANLQRQAAASEDTSKEITVVFQGDLNEYSK